MPTAVYYVQCVEGDPSHVMEVVAGSELEQECKERAATGRVDALVLEREECPGCIAEMRARRNAQMCGSTDRPCPFSSFLDEADYDPCASGCKAVTSFGTIEESPYRDQLRGLPANG